MRPVAAVTLGLLLFMDAVRVLLPSLITIYGQAGDTPPEQLGLFAALWFVLPLAALSSRRHGRCWAAARCWRSAASRSRPPTAVSRSST